MLKNGIKLAILLCTIIGLTTTSLLFAHCDTLNGPVIADAKHALQTNDIKHVLKWIKKEHEAEIKSIFQKVLEVRHLNSTAKELADHSFFETVVRLHRAGENAQFTGLTSETLPPVLAEADKSLQTGSIDVLLKMMLSDIKAELQQKFKNALDKKPSANISVENGREYVEAYVTFVHYVEALDRPGGLQTEHSH